jgi:hypothetical protein
LERIKRDRKIGLGLRKIKGKQGGLWQKCHLLPPLRIRTERRGGAGLAGRQGRPPAAPATATAGDKGKRKRGARGS